MRTYDVVMTPSDDGPWVLKSEADKVIAELKRENKRLEKEASCTFSDDCLRLRQTKRKLRYQKYKRCLAMASYWVAVSYKCVDDKHHQNAERHHRKWLELADKFKEEAK